MISVRNAHVTDAEVLAALNAEFNGVELAAERFRATLESSQNLEVILVAEQEHRVIGFLCMHKRVSACYARPSFEVTELYVQPRFRRSGAAKNLLQQGALLAVSAGASELSARTGMSNQTARTVYERSGYKLCSEVVYRLRQNAA